MTFVTTRRRDELQAQCREHGLVVDGTESREELTDKLRAALGYDIAYEVDPMKAKETKSLIRLTEEGLDYSGLNFLFNDDYWAEPKLDGVRMRLFIGEDKSVIKSGRRSVRTFSYLDRSENFPHLAELSGKGLAGCILDGELLAPVSRLQTHTGTWTDSLLNSSVALANSKPAGSLAVQRKFGCAHFYAFDILAISGVSLMDQDYDFRRRVLEEVVCRVHLRFPESRQYFFVIPKLKSELSSLMECLEQGYEGLVIKDRNSKYFPGKRDGWWKVKQQATADGIICGYNPGEFGNQGMVGSLELGVVVEQDEPGVKKMMLDGKVCLVRPVSQVGNLTNELRLEVTAEDGSLRQDWYGRVVEFGAQGIGRHGRTRHAYLKRLRPDKSPLDCNADQLAVFSKI